MRLYVDGALRVNDVVNTGPVSYLGANRALRVGGASR